MASSNEIVHLNNIVKTYKTNTGDFTALKNVDMSVGGGEFVAVIGKSGSGKTTLINMINDIDYPLWDNFVSKGNWVLLVTALRVLNAVVIFLFCQVDKN